MAALPLVAPPSAAPARQALPRSLTWLAALGFSVVLLAAAVQSAKPAALGATALVIGLAALFVVRPMASLLVIVLIHQSVDLWADGKLESFGGLKYNLSTALTLMIVIVGGAYLVENWREARTGPSSLPFAALIAIATASLVKAPSVSLGVAEVLRLDRVGVVYGLVYLLCRSRRELQLVAGSLLVSVLGVIAVALEQILTAGGRSGLGVFEFNRATGGFAKPDELGIVLGMLLCFSVPLLLGGRLRWWPGLVAWIAVAGVALVGSYTRTGWITLTVGLLVVGIMRYRPLLLIVPIVVTAVAIAVPSTVHRFSDLTQGPRYPDRPGNTLSSRISLWRSDLPMINQSPVIGNGFGSIEVKQGQLAHSDYVRTAVETGPLGLTAFVWLVLSGVVGSTGALRRTLRGWPRGLLSATAAGAIGVSVAYLMASADSNLMTKPVVAGGVWTMIALGHAAGRLSSEPAAQSTSRLAPVPWR